jgi:hypothetical protein
MSYCLDEQLTQSVGVDPELVDQRWIATISMEYSSRVTKCLDGSFEVLCAKSFKSELRRRRDFAEVSLLVETTVSEDSWAASNAEAVSKKQVPLVEVLSFS